MIEAHPDWTWDDPDAVRWLSAVVRLKAADAVRRRLRQPCLHLADLDSLPADDAPRNADEDEDQRRQDLTPALEDALTRLDDVNREIVIRRQQGESYQQIGSLRGVAPAMCAVELVAGAGVISGRADSR